MKDYKRLFPFIRPNLKYIILATIATALVSAADGATAWLVQPILDDIFIKKDTVMLKLLPLAIIVVYLIKETFRFISSYYMSYAGNKTVMEIRNSLYTHLQGLSIKFFSDNRTGELLSRVINDIGTIQGLVSISIKDFVKELLTSIALISVLFYRDWKLASISIFVLPLSAYFMARIGTRLRDLSRKGQEKIADISNILVETSIGIRVIKGFGMESHMSHKFLEENERFFKIMKKTIKYSELSSPLIEAIGAVGLAAIIYYGGSNVINGTTTVGNFFSFITALLMMYAPIRRIGNIHNSVQKASASADRIFELFDKESDIKEKENFLILKDFKDTIEFDRVSFNYADDKQILKDISLKVKKQETIAIVGMSGSGKSTLISLVPRFYDVTTGSIKIDGVDIREFSISSLRKNIGIVAQDIFLFNDTIKTNIAFGDPLAGEDKIIEAAKVAHAHQFIETFSEGYNTIIGERGLKLSGGERQRISIARAVLKNPAILILDEATSSLDAESEHIVQEALNNLMKNRTTFIIAHRFSTIINADKIVVIENGEISATGTHKELLENPGMYKKVFERQFVYA